MSNQKIKGYLESQITLNSEKLMRYQKVPEILERTFQELSRFDFLNFEAKLAITHLRPNSTRFCVSLNEMTVLRIIGLGKIKLDLFLNDNKS